MCDICEFEITSSNEDAPTICKSCYWDREEFLKSDEFGRKFPNNIFFTDMDRERDNIRWIISAGSPVWPIYGRLEYHEVGDPIRLSRNYFCHDNNLHSLHGRVCSLDGSYTHGTQQLRQLGFKNEYSVYAYKFHASRLTDDGWIIGFLAKADNILAEDVEE